ncbi:MAG: hypothetical protein KJO69_09205 [Gammaproteobacteria bacterium]|nr:hypothetical protein [Gammaproteobacteria bacterium]
MKTLEEEWATLYRMALTVYWMSFGSSLTIDNNPPFDFAWIAYMVIGMTTMLIVHRHKIRHIKRKNEELMRAFSQ